MSQLATEALNAAASQAAVVDRDPFDGPPLVLDPDAAAPAPAGSVPAAEAAPPAASAAPAPDPAAVVPPVVTDGAAPPAPAPVPTDAPAAAAPAPGLDKATQKLQQDMVGLAQSVQELKELLAASKAVPAAPAAAPAAPAPSPAPAPDELEAMLAEDYEVDVSADPKKIVKGLLAREKSLREQLAQVQQTATQQALAEIETRTAAREGQREFERLQAAHAGTDLTAMFTEARQQAAQEGYGNLGDKALAHRASQIWQAKLAALTPAPAPVPAPAPAAAAVPNVQRPTSNVQPAAAGAPAPTPGGANVRVPNVGGSPVKPASGVLSEDEIYERHTLVRNP